MAKDNNTNFRRDSSNVIRGPETSVSSGTNNLSNLSRYLSSVIDDVILVHRNSHETASYYPSSHTRSITFTTHSSSSLNSNIYFNSSELSMMRKKFNKGTKKAHDSLASSQRWGFKYN
jgi:hypothetical protein